MSTATAEGVWLPEPTWHFAADGCLCVHPNGDPSYGWVVRPDGSAEFVRHEPEDRAA